MAALHERLVFDTERGAGLDGPRRYVLMRADVLMGVFANLDGEARTAALDALRRSVAEHGSDSVRVYREAVAPQALPALMEATAASLGWGRWQFDADDLASVHPHADANPAAAPRLRLAVADSPFAAAAPHGSVACHAIAGMLEAVGGAIFDAPVDARETHCAAQGGDAVCRFVATPRTSASPIVPTSSHDTPARRHRFQGDPS